MKLRMWILLIILAVCAVPLFAQTAIRPVVGDDGTTTEGTWSGTTSYRQGKYLDNPCTYWEDLVLVDYSAYVQSAQKEAGADRWLFNESTSVSGDYAATGTSLSDVAYASPVSIRKYYKVNTADDFHVVTVINFDPVALTTAVTVETACGNGMPDAKE